MFFKATQIGYPAYNGVLVRLSFFGCGLGVVKFKAHAGTFFCIYNIRFCRIFRHLGFVVIVTIPPFTAIHHTIEPSIKGTL